MKQSRLHRAGVAGLLSALWLLGITPPTLRAQEEVKRPVLGGHTFLQNNLFPGAFIETSTRTLLGVGRALNVETLPPIQIDTLEFGGKRGDLYFATLALGYEHALTEWFGLGGQFGLATRLGDGANTILAQGVTMDFMFDLGARFRLLQGESATLVAGASLQRDNMTVLDFRTWVEGLLEDEDVPLVQKRPSTRYGLNLVGGWAPVHWIGLQGFAGASRGKNLEADPEDEWYNSIGAAVDFDLLSVSSIPIGFVVGVRRDTFPRSANDLAEAVYGSLFRVAYTGRTDFVIALDATMDRVPLREGDNIEAGTIQFSTRYYF